MLKDAPRIFNEFNTILEEYGSKKSLFVMGLSLGSISAVEIAYHHQNAIQGLIIESGSATPLNAPSALQLRII
jgi:pimeloyl-ACP methyl ester carboxylesterase